MRRSKYTSHILKPDYFILKHLKGFIDRTLKEHIQQNFSVADVGCGEQPFRTLIESSGANYTGIDVQQNQFNTVDIIGFIEDMPIDDETFDIVLCSEVLEHVNVYQKGFEELCRILKKGGTLIITTPFLYPLHEEPYDKQRLTIHNFYALCKSNSISILDVHKSGNEIEVLAEIWDNLWIRQGYNNRWQKFRGTVARIPVNIVALLISRLFSTYFPKKAYLSNMLVLQK